MVFAFHRSGSKAVMLSWVVGMLYPMPSPGTDLPSLTVNDVSRLTNAVNAFILDDEAVCAIYDQQPFLFTINDPLVSAQGRVLREPPGPSSRRTGLVISEIMYHPPAQGEPPLPGSFQSAEFIELHNSNPWAEDISGYRLVADTFKLTLPPNTVLEQGGFLVVADRPMPGLTRSALVSQGLTLHGDSDTVKLLNPQGAVLLEVTYTDDPPWPLQADGWGHSLVLARPSFGENDPRAWAASAVGGGSPGTWDLVISDPIQLVLINELGNLAPSAFVELYNPTPWTLDLSGTWYSNGQARIPAGGSIRPGGFMELPYFEGALITADQSQVIGVVTEVPTLPAWGRSPDGSERFALLSAPTPGSSNLAPLPEPVVISELTYAPISGDENDQYIELHNQGQDGTNIAGWSLEGDIQFTFPDPTWIPPGGYLVVAKSTLRLWTDYPQLNPANTVGDFLGRLQPEGGTVTLEIQRPGPDIRYPLHYGGAGMAGVWSRGGGSSSELIDARADNRLAGNWTDSDESGKSEWVSIEVMGTLGETLGTGTNDHLQVMLLGAGECLLDDVEVRNGNGPNLLPDFNFEAGGTGWQPHGSHDESTVEPHGYQGSRSLLLRASAPGDPIANLVQSPPFTAPAAGTVTLRAKARWLRGSPELLLRLHGGGLEAAGLLPVPMHLGTPGLPNSRAVTNAGPAIDEVNHWPLLPAADEAVRVAARVTDPDGVRWVMLRCSPGLESGYTWIPMVDDGAGGDAAPRDAIYTATIPGQPAGATMAFSIEAGDASSSASVATTIFPLDAFPRDARRTFPSDAVTRECVVRWGEAPLPGVFPTYQLWMTRENQDRWSQRPALHSAPLDGTFVYNRCRVIYNAGPRYCGSPRVLPGMIDPLGPTLTDYLVGFPEEGPFLGAQEIFLATPGRSGGQAATDPSALVSAAAHRLLAALDLPQAYRRHAHVLINGSRRTGQFIMEDVQGVDPDFVREWFPQDQAAQLYAIQGWSEFDRATARYDYRAADLVRRTTVLAGETNLNPAPYRFMWRKQSLGLAAGLSDNGALSSLIDSISPASNPGSVRIENERLLDEEADMSEWLRLIAVQHAIGNWDSYGYLRGESGFAYRNDPGRFLHLPGKVQSGFGLSESAGPTADLFATHDSRLAAVLETPHYRRIYLQALQELSQGPFQMEQLAPFLDSRAAALEASRIPVSAAVAAMKEYVAQRRAYILSQLTAPPFALSTPASLSTSSNFVVVSGTAPAAVDLIRVNGTAYPLTWISPTDWSMPILLKAPENHLVLEAYDPAGNLLQELHVDVRCTGLLVPPANPIALTEIMTASLPQAGFVEVQNTSSAFALDLSEWQLLELGYAFPEETFLLPGEFLVLARDRRAFAQAYGAAVGVADVYSGSLNPAGGTLTLLGAGRPTPVLLNELMVNAPPPELDYVELYNAGAEDLDISNFSLSDDFQVGKFVFPAVTVIPAHAFLALDELVLGFGLRGAGEQLYLRAADATLLDCLQYKNAPTNGLIVGRFPDGAPDFYRLAASTPAEANHAAAELQPQASCFSSTDVALAPLFRIRYEAAPPWPTAPSLPGASLQVVDPTQDNARVSNWTLGPDPTPGAPSSAASPLPPYPKLWLNEVQVSNQGWILDNAGEADPWLELYYAGSEPLSLEGYYLSDQYEQLAQWSFPTGTVLHAGQYLLVWLDGEESESTLECLHAGFALSSATGSIALSRSLPGRVQLLDYLTYSNLAMDLSYGSMPDGQAADRFVLTALTPGQSNQGNATNAPSALLPPVRVNEWMAKNKHTIIDPADNDADDWVELYNAGRTPVRLDGYFLGDSPSAAREWRFPTGTVIPAFGQLLVWVDGEVNQNDPQLNRWHANFSLGGSGDEIVLSAPDGRVMDLIRFGEQTTDVSEGRYFDGGPRIFQMPKATPGQANVVFNTPPIVPPLRDRVVRVGENMSVTATATDEQAPPQSLFFRLGTGSPVGARIDMLTGLFRWRPLPMHAGSTNLITVWVSDDGSPSLRAEARFKVIVAQESFFIEDLSMASDGSLFRWTTVPGRTYRVEYKDSLNAPEWVPADVVRVGDGSVQTFNISPSGSPQRFFRVVELTD